MAGPADPAELALVQKAICSETRGCCEWDEKAALRLQRDASLGNLTPSGAIVLLRQHVQQGGNVLQVQETRPEWNDRPFYYKVIVPFPGLAHGLFFEIVLDDDDPDFPSVRIVSAHEQRR